MAARTSPVPSADDDKVHLYYSTYESILFADNFSLEFNNCFPRDSWSHQDRVKLYIERLIARVAYDALFAIYDPFSKSPNFEDLHMSFFIKETKKHFGKQLPSLITEELVASRFNWHQDHMPFYLRKKQEELVTQEEYIIDTTCQDADFTLDSVYDALKKTGLPIFEETAKELKDYFQSKRDEHHG